MSDQISSAEAHARATSGWIFQARVRAVRLTLSVVSALNLSTPPMAPSPSKTEWIDATLGEKKKQKAIRLDLYYPSGRDLDESTLSHGSSTGGESTSGVEGNKGRPALIMFHGGGFVIGHGTDDAKFGSAFASHPSIRGIAIGVTYRLAPEYPFPTPVEDCASAILHISTHASAYGIDKERIFVAGFSAGGNLAFSALNLLHCDPNVYAYGYDLPDQVEIPKIRGVLGFYPLLDYSISREEKRATTADPSATLPPSLTTMFDTSYIPPGTDLLDPRISPSRASDEVLERLPPVHMVLCEKDMLRHEAEVFKERLEKMGKKVTTRLVEGEPHGWDKPLPLWQKESVGVEYAAALAEVEKILQGQDSG